MGRNRMGNPKRKSKFICLKCMRNNGVGDGIQRNNHQREYGHIKDLFCIYCKEETKNIEIRYCDDYTRLLNIVPELHMTYYESSQHIK